MELDATFYLRERRHVDESTGCWNWTLSVDTGGYGQAQFEKRKVSAHRLAYETWIGSVELGKCVCHHCDNRRCIRPSHLFLGTCQDNMDDCVRKGRIGRAKGETNAAAKITENDVLEIRRRSATEKYGEIAKDYPMLNPLSLPVIVRGKSWSHVPVNKENPLRRSLVINTRKLTPEIVMRVREACTTQRNRDIAKQFGISQYHVSLIKHRKIWKNLTD